jgi:hypothetical protein
LRQQQALNAAETVNAAATAIVHRPVNQVHQYAAPWDQGGGMDTATSF